jgi:hypothetical protein
LLPLADYERCFFVNSGSSNRIYKKSFLSGNRTVSDVWETSLKSEKTNKKAIKTLVSLMARQSSGVAF